MCFHATSNAPNGHTVQHVPQHEQGALQLCHHAVSLLDYHHIHHLDVPLLCNHKLQELLLLPGLWQRCVELHAETSHDKGIGLVRGGALLVAQHQPLGRAEVAGVATMVGGRDDRNTTNSRSTH
jgi:hypothetical protein